MKTWTVLEIKILNYYRKLQKEKGWSDYETVNTAKTALTDRSFKSIEYKLKTL